MASHDRSYSLEWMFFAAYAPFLSARLSIFYLFSVLKKGVEGVH